MSIVLLYKNGCRWESREDWGIWKSSLCLVTLSIGMRSSGGILMALALASFSLRVDSSVFVYDGVLSYTFVYIKGFVDLLIKNKY